MVDGPQTDPGTVVGGTLSSGPATATAAGEKSHMGRSALEYGLANTGCPIVTILPGEGHGMSRWYGSHIPLSWQSQDRMDRIIAGFPGVLSYRLALVAIQPLLNK